MKLEQKQKKKLKMSMRCLILVLILLPLLVVATYTWFSISRTPRVSEMGMSIDCGTGMELAFAPNSDDWTQHLDFTDHVKDKGVLKPVTWSERNHCFYAAEFGRDGRITGIKDRLSDSTNTNSSGSNGYYLKYTCYARTDEDVSVSLTPAVVGADGKEGAGTYVIGAPVWNSEEVSHTNAGNGAEYAIRVGFNITLFDSESETRKGKSVFYIYEPNCDGHKDGENGFVETESIDGTETLVPIERLIEQTSSTWTEAEPIQKDVLVRNLGEFNTDTHLFNLKPEEFAKIDIYVWLEGQDVDCTNEIGEQAEIFVNIQFKADVTTGSGMEEIE